MSSHKNLLVLFALCLATTLAQSAPAEMDSSTTPMAPEPSTTPAPDTARKESSTTAASGEASSMPVSSAQDQARVPNTSFTCFNRPVGYYADVDSSCKVYHFCMLGDYNGQEVYQRISYLCLKDTIFDQQALDCVDSSKILAPCAESAKYYDESNTVLRQAMIGKPAVEGEKVDSTRTTHEATTAASEASSTVKAAAAELAAASADTSTSTTTTEAPKSS